MRAVAWQNAQVRGGDVFMKCVTDRKEYPRILTLDSREAAAAQVSPCVANDEDIT